jgi:hypothetical protein
MLLPLPMLMLSYGQVRCSARASPQWHLPPLQHFFSGPNQTFMLLLLPLPPPLLFHALLDCRLFCARWSSTASASLSALQSAAASLQLAAELDETTQLLLGMRSHSAIISSIAALSAAAPAGMNPAAASTEDAGLLQLVSQQLQQQLLPRWSSRWPNTFGGSGASQILVTLGLRRQFLQCLQLQEIWRQPQQRQQLASVIDVGLAELQLQAAADLAAQRCTDPARVLLREHESDIVRLRAAQLIGQQQAGVLDVRRCIVAVEVSNAQLQARPAEQAYKQTLEQNMQVSSICFGVALLLQRRYCNTT